MEQYDLNVRTTSDSCVLIMKAAHQISTLASRSPVATILYVPPGLTSNNSTFCPHTVFMCSVWISEQTAIISLYNINWFVFITEAECVYCAVRTEGLRIMFIAVVNSTGRHALPS